MKIEWCCKAFNEISATELYQILQLRSEVFVVEQNCVYQDIDGKDLKSLHLWAQNEKGKVLSYCRILPPGVSYDYPAIGRVVSSQDFRGMGLSREAMKKSIDKIFQMYPQSGRITLSAQLYLEKFYTSLGFRREGDVYDEDGIPHIQMSLDY